MLFFKLFSHLVAFFLPIVLYLFWWFVGYAILAVCYTQRNLLQNMLLAPAIGMALTLLLIFCFSSFGLPVEQFAGSLFLFLLLLSAGLWWKCRPVVPSGRRYLPFAAILFAALFLTGRPLLEYGFEWLSYTNDDMVNYCLGAIWFLHHGQNANVNVAELLRGQDYSLYYWFLFVPGMTRCGSELLLAWISKITTLSPEQIFMPVIMAMHLMLISTTAALLYQSRRWRLVTLTVCVLLTVSAMVSLGTVYQLIAQVGGLSLLNGNFTLLLKRYSFRNKKSIFCFSLLTAILVSALLIDYPELFPFLVLTFFVYHGLNFVIKRNKPSTQFLISLGIGAIVTLFILNKNILNVYTTLVGQAGQGLAVADIEHSLFPYFLVPSGLADLWGFHALAWYVPEPFLSASILFGALLLIFVLISAFWLAYRWCSAVAVIFLIMFSVGLVLFINKNDFGLFKLAMYIQPYMFATAVMGWFNITKKPIWRWSPLVLLGIINLFFQYAYLERSRNYRTTDIPGASQTKINVEFEKLLNSHKQNKHWVLDTHHIVLGKFQSIYLRGKEAIFPSRNFYVHIETLYKKTAILEQLRCFKPQLLQQADSLFAKINQNFPNVSFNMHDKNNPKSVNIFNFIPFKITDDLMLVMTTPKQTILNRRELAKNIDVNFVAVPWKNENNHLIFVRSALGQHYYLPIDFVIEARSMSNVSGSDISYNMLERDHFYPNQKYVGIGRHLLFEVVNPTPKVRLELSITDTLNADSKNKLPPAAVIGNERTLLPIVGRGSARVFSAPITPQWIHHTPYIALDMGVDGKNFPNYVTGLMKLYGTKVVMDKRKLVGFARDISLVSEQQYQHLNPPSFVKDFPNDLANPDLEYSGMYEDGWVAESSYFNLLQKKSAPILFIKGQLPQSIHKKVTQQLSVFVDGKKIKEQKISENQFVIKIPVSVKSSRRHIELHFLESYPISSDDMRPVSAYLSFIGFVSKANVTELEKEQRANGADVAQRSIFKLAIHSLFARIKTYMNSMF